MERKIETKVTDWVICKDGPWYPTLSHGGFKAYRIWQQFDGVRWFQRHEWERADGSFEKDAWINGVSGFLPSSKPASEDQPSIAA